MHLMEVVERAKRPLKPQILTRLRINDHCEGSTCQHRDSRAGAVSTLRRSAAWPPLGDCVSKIDAYGHHSL